MPYFSQLAELKHLCLHGSNGLYLQLYKKALIDEYTYPCMYGYGLVLVDRYALTTAMCEYGCDVKHVLDLNPLMPSCITLAVARDRKCSNQRKH